MGDVYEAAMIEPGVGSLARVFPKELSTCQLPGPRGVTLVA